MPRSGVDINNDHAAESYKPGTMPGVTPSAAIAEALQTFTGLDRGDTIYMTAADGNDNFVPSSSRSAPTSDPASSPATPASCCTTGGAAST